jgi:hypothetical protein
VEFSGLVLIAKIALRPRSDRATAGSVISHRLTEAYRIFAQSLLVVRECLMSGTTAEGSVP